MTFLHNNPVLPSLTIQELGQFVRNWREQWAMDTPDFERFEHELHEHIMAIERELLAEELARYDVTAEQIEIDGVEYRQTLTSSETYVTAAGEVSVTRNLYRPAGRGSKSICPLELRAGIIGGYWTPRAARQAAFVVAHVTPGQSETMFDELGGMRPSRCSLDRLPKELSPHWEARRQEWEVALRARETVPYEAAVLAMSVDGVTVRMKGSDRCAKRDQPGKHASGPTGQKEAGCGTVILYDAEGERLQTVRYGRMPESKKVTLQQQLETEVMSVLAVRPDLKRVLLSDGAKDNWRLLNEVDQACGPPPQPSVEIVDFCHACDHLKKGCDAAWGESTPRSKAEFERLKTLLKEEDDGAERVIRVFKYHRGRAQGRKRERLETQLTYFRNQRHRMHYAEYIRQDLPIASGVMEASCKTLVTQRLKQSGMSWTQAGGQPILTLRSLIQSDRWQPAWELLRADFRKTVTVCDARPTLPNVVPREQTSVLYPIVMFNHFDCAAIPVVA
ncbi:MAG: hypothetical protein V3S14_16470 [Anaerolineae bacterium]